MPAHASPCSVCGDSALILIVLSGTADDSCGQGTHSLRLALREAWGAHRSFCSVYCDSCYVQDRDRSDIIRGRLID
jgi:hypothetical protein